MSCTLYEAAVWNTLLFKNLPDASGVFAQSNSIRSVSPIDWVLICIRIRKEISGIGHHLQIKSSSQLKYLLYS